MSNHDPPPVSGSAAIPSTVEQAATAAVTAPFSQTNGAGLHLAYTVRAMKVYGVTDEHLDLLDSTHTTASNHYAVATFAVGILVNVATNAIFQDKISDIAIGIMIGLVPVCIIGAVVAYLSARSYEQSRENQIQKIRSQSVYIDPKNDELMKLFEQIKTITSGTS